MARAGKALPDPAMVLAATAKGLVDELARALQAGAGVPVKASAPEVVSLGAAELAGRLDRRFAAFCLDLGGALRGRAAILLPAPVVAGLAALLGGAAPESAAKRAAAEITDDMLEALAGPVAGALVGIGEKIAAFVGEQPGLGLGDAVLAGPGASPDLLRLIGRGPYPLAGFTLDAEKVAAGPALLLFPASFEAAPPAGPAESALPAAGEAPAPGAPAGDPLARLHPNIRRVLRLKLQVSVVVAEKPMDMDAVIKLNPGTIIEFDKSADQDLDLTINGQRIGAGEVVIIGERFGIQLKSVEGLRQRLQKMGVTAS